jgi:hypothetical protein
MQIFHAIRRELTLLTGMLSISALATTTAAQTAAPTAV